MATQLILSAGEIVFWGLRDANNQYTYGGLSTTLANGSDAAMRRLYGLESMIINANEARRETTPADNSNIATFTGNPIDPISGTLDLKVRDLDFLAGITGLSVYALNGRSGRMISQNCAELNPFSLIVNQRTKVYNTQAKRWRVVEIHNIEATDPSNSISGVDIAGATVSLNTTLNSAIYTLSGELISSTNYGATRAEMFEFDSDYPCYIQTHKGNGTDTAVTLAYAPVADAAAYVEVVQDGTRLTYSTNFSTTGTAFTFVSAPSAGVISEIKVFFDPTAC